MRITYITAGAGGMYCGSCIRDNALAAALIAKGHEVLLLPTYTPILTDENNVSVGRVFFGGVSVYLEQHLPLFRHTPWLLDRLWDAPWFLRAVSSSGISTRPEKLGNLVVSVLKGTDGHQAKEIKKLLNWLGDQPKPDIVNITNSMLISLAGPIKDSLDVPVCCTLQGEDFFLNQIQEPYHGKALELIHKGVKHVDRFLAISDYYAGHMSRYLKIPGAKMDVVPLGIDVSGYQRHDRQKGEFFKIGHFGRIAPEKGLHHLFEVYKRLRLSGRFARGQIAIAGYLAPEYVNYLEAILKQAHQCGLESEITYYGKLDRQEKIDFLNTLDVMVAPSTYDDPKGMALIEAMACGVPVVVPRRGTYTELVERTGGGLFIHLDDLDAFANTLAALRSDPARCAELGRRGADGVRTWYTSKVMADRAIDVYSSLIR